METSDDMDDAVNHINGLDAELVIAKLPPPEVWLDESDAITIPFDAMLPRVRTGGSQFGSYRVASWIEA